VDPFSSSFGSEDLQTAPQVRKIARGMTLYASRFDKALAASASAAREVRAGDVSEGGPIVLPEMDSIDVSALGEEMFGLNHSTFAERRELIEDIKALLESGRRPPRGWVDRLSAVPASPPPLQFWRCAPQ
jgi:esterase/lipase superfamily enzyme